MRRLCLAFLLLAATLPASAQERQFSVTMPESQWNSLAKILGKVPWPAEETTPLLAAISQQIGGALGQESAARASAAKELADLKAEVARLTGELGKLKNPPPEAPQ